ncbi:uncharacterized protein SMIM43 [Manis javanica]|uniref:uncharacterized protein SMIM43 n=1 Tax=Manis javanica TaxID=9974 RepID=UPI003C6D0216
MLSGHGTHSTRITHQHRNPRIEVNPSFFTRALIAGSAEDLRHQSLAAEEGSLVVEKEWTLASDKLRFKWIWGQVKSALERYQSSYPFPPVSYPYPALVLWKLLSSCRCSNSILQAHTGSFEALTFRISKEGTKML